MYYFPHPVYYYPVYRQFPPVNPELLHESALESKKLMKDASTILNKLSESTGFATELMNAAQASNTSKLNELISSTGITSNVSVTYNPDGLRLEFHSKIAHLECCRLLVALRWQ